MKKLFTVLSLWGLLHAGPLQAQNPSVPGVSSGRATSPPVPAAGDPLYAPVARTNTPQSLLQRVLDYAVVTTGPRALFAPAITAAIRMARPPDAYPRDWRQGAQAYGRNYGNALASRSARETARFVTGAILHEDFRYRPSTSGNLAARGFHALSYTFLDSSDSGHVRIAFANLAAAGAEGFTGNLYLPEGYNNVPHAETRTAFAFGSLAAQNVLREFAPDLLKLSRKLHLPFPRAPFPDWWVKIPAR